MPLVNGDEPPPGLLSDDDDDVDMLGGFSSSDDDEEVVFTRNCGTAQVESTTDTDWTKDGAFPTPHEFRGNPGMKVQPVTDDPIGFMDLFFKHSDVDNLVRETNRYFDQQVAANDGGMKPNSRMKMWTPVTQEEMRRFLALFMSMGLCVKPSIEDYWAVEALVATPSFGRIMALKRFQEIMRYFHVADSSEDTPDKLHRIRPLLNAYTTRSRDTYVCDRELTIDEGSIAWRGNISYRTYNPSKPHKYHIRVYKLCEAASGYTSSFEVSYLIGINNLFLIFYNGKMSAYFPTVGVDRSFDLSVPRNRRGPV